MTALAQPMTALAHVPALGFRLWRDARAVHGRGGSRSSDPRTATAIDHPTEGLTSTAVGTHSRH